MRECGNCSACCRLLHIEELEKPAGTMCPQLRRMGRCGIYATRPGECSRFACGWLAGAMDALHRPDKVGYVMTRERDASGAWESAVVLDGERTPDPGALASDLGYFVGLPDVLAFYVVPKLGDEMDVFKVLPAPPRARANTLAALVVLLARELSPERIRAGREPGWAERIAAALAKVFGVGQDGSGELSGGVSNGEEDRGDVAGRARAGEGSA